MTYEYLCAACGHRWEAQQSISEAPIKECPQCHALEAKRQISRGGGFILKGGGWYSDLYSSSGASKSTSSDSTSSSATGIGGLTGCPDPCVELLRKIDEHMKLMDRKYTDMLADRRGLYTLAYSTNPGGALAGFGTWLGHVQRYDGLRIGLQRMIDQANAMGCKPIPPRAYDLIARPTPSSPS